MRTAHNWYQRPPSYYQTHGLRIQTMFRQIRPPSEVFLPILTGIAVILVIRAITGIAMFFQSFQGPRAANPR